MWVSNQYKVGNSSTNGSGETSGVGQQPGGPNSAITASKQSQTTTYLLGLKVLKNTRSGIENDRTL